MVLLVLAACSDTVVGKYSDPLVVTLDAPADPPEFDEGIVVGLTGHAEGGTAGDPSDLLAAWSVNGAAICPSATFTGDGDTSCDSAFEAGSAVVTLKVTAPDGETAEDTLTLTILPDSNPTADIESPTESGAYTSLAPITFKGTVADAEDAAEELTIAWTSSVDGDLGLASTPTSDGIVTGSATLSPGSHVVTLLVTDSRGHTGQDVVSIQVAGGEAPEIEIVDPASGSSSVFGEYVHFIVDVSDDVTVPEDIDLTWESDIDGVFSTEGASSAGQAELFYDGLSAGSHVVTVTATDGEGFTSVDSVFLEVGLGDAPDVDITAPSAGTSIDRGEGLTFVATVGDDLTAPDDLALAWSSNVDGVLDTTPASSAGSASFYTTGLSVGVHTITLAATDEFGQTSTDTTTVIVSNGTAPTLTIDAPIDSDSFHVGDSVVFALTASDDHTAATALAVDCESDLDGSLWSGNPDSSGDVAFTTTGLSLGEHTVTCTATDDDGYSTTARVHFSIEIGDAPDVLFLSPTSGSTATWGTAVDLSATVGDDVTDPTDLDLVWASSLDGVLSTDGADASGAADVRVSGLSHGTHTLTLTATDGDGLVGTDTITLIVDDGDAPDVQIDAPADGATRTIGEAIDFEATVADDVTAATALTIEWSSDLDGVLSTAKADATGYAHFTSSSLSVGTHLITLSVTDGNGLTTTDTARLTVDLGDSPTVEIALPLLGDVYNEDEVIAFSADVGDDRTAPGALDLTWSSNLDGVLDSSPADSSGLAEFVSSGLSIGTHTVTLTAVDTDGLTSTDTVSFVVNGIPSAPSVHISPTSPDTDDALTVVIDSAAVDPDGDALTYSYTWTKDGSATPYTTGVPASATTRGEVWTVTVRASDADSTGPSASDSISIVNAIPALASVSITPSVAYTNDTLTALPTGFSDGDGDASSLSYQWYADGVAISGATDETLDGAYFSRDENITVSVWPSDGYTTGSPVTSSARVISDTAPTVPVVTVTPEQPDPGETLTCAISTPSTDADGDAISYTYAWTLNGSPTAYTSNTVSGSATAMGETWTCTVTPSDGTLDGGSGSDSVVVDDYTAPGAPTLDSLYAWQNETTVVVTGDAEAYATITLYQTSSSGTTSSSTTADASGAFSFTQTVTVGLSYTWYATATDSEGNVSAASNVIGTEVCATGESYEDSTGYGDACADSIDEWGTLNNASGGTFAVSGNILAGGDSDWYSFTTANELSAAMTTNPYSFSVTMTAGTGNYAITVYAGGCSSGYLECSGSGSQYSDFPAESGDYIHSTHTDAAACTYSTSPEYNTCESFATTYYVQVSRTTTVASCEGYSLSVYSHN